MHASWCTDFDHEGNVGCIDPIIPWAGGGDDFVYLSQLEGEPVEVIIAPDARPLTVVEALSLRDALEAAVEMTQSAA